MGNDNLDEWDLDGLKEILKPVSANKKQSLQDGKLKLKLTIASEIPTVMRKYVITSIGETDRCWSVGA